MRVDSAVDCGKVVNPDRVLSQMESSAVFSATLALYGEIDLEQGQVIQGNFDDHPLARIQAVGPTHIHLIESNEKPTGVREPVVPPFAPTLANAIFAASGKRYGNLSLISVMVIYRKKKLLDNHIYSNLRRLMDKPPFQCVENKE